MMSRIMNEDVVEEILKYLKFRQLFQIERTSKQFRFCVNRLLRRKKFLNFGSEDCSAFCGHSKHNNEDPFKCPEPFEFVLIYSLTSIVSKCSNIRSLYLDRFLPIESIKSIALICERLECLSLGYIFLISNSDQLQTIGLIFGPKVIHLSIDCYFIDCFNEDKLNYKVKELVIHFTGLQHLRIRSHRQLSTALNFVANQLKCLHITCIPFWFSDSLGDKAIDSLIDYIKGNNKCLKSLIITDYHISEKTLALICDHLDLRHLAISCNLLSANSLIQILVKSQNSLSSLTLKGLSIKDIHLDYNRDHLNVKSLRLISCDFEINCCVKFMKIFRFIKKLEFTQLFFECECIATNEMANCSKCNHCLQELSKSKTLKVLIVNISADFFPFWQSLTAIESLQKLEVQNISPINSKYLALNLIKVLKSKTTKYFRLQFNTMAEKSIFTEQMNALCETMPRNLIIDCRRNWINE